MQEETDGRGGFVGVSNSLGTSEFSCCCSCSGRGLDRSYCHDYLPTILTNSARWKSSERAKRLVSSIQSLHSLGEKESVLFLALSVHCCLGQKGSIIRRQTHVKLKKKLYCMSATNILGRKKKMNCKYIAPEMWCCDSFLLSHLINRLPSRHTNMNMKNSIAAGCYHLLDWIFLEINVAMISSWNSSTQWKKI